MDTGAPSILPKDMSYFDFRTQGGRFVPSGDAPNLVIRYNSGEEQGQSSMMMVAFSYRAMEGNREGFIAFGSLIFEPFLAEKIVEAIEAAISIAKKSKDFFDGRTITQRPSSVEGRRLDLTALPLLEGNHLFGELSANINDRDTIKSIAEIAHQLVSSGLNGFEVVANPQRGMSPSALMTHFSEITIQQRQLRAKLDARNRRLEDDRKLTEALEAGKREAESERKTWLLQVFAFGISGFAVLLLGLFMILQVSGGSATGDGDDIENQQTLESDDSDAEHTPSGESNPEDSRATNLEATEAQSSTCVQQDQLNDKSRPRIYTDLLTEDRCIEIDEGLSFIAARTIKQLVAANEVGLGDIDWQGGSDDIFLTSFGRFIDANHQKLNDVVNKFFAEPNYNYFNLLKDHGLTLSVSMEQPEPVLICSEGFMDKDPNSRDELKFQFYTESQYEYRSAIEWLSVDVLDTIAWVLSKIREDLTGEKEEQSKIQRLAREMWAHNFESPNKLSIFPGQWDNKGACVVVVTQEDQYSFLEKYGTQNTKQHSMQDFVKLSANLGEKYAELVEGHSNIECSKIPSLFMIRRKNPEFPFIMTEVKGFTPFTMEGGKTLDVHIKPINFIDREDRYSLPQHKAFSGLERYYDLFDETSSPFERPYDKKGFCIASPLPK